MSANVYELASFSPLSSLPRCLSLPFISSASSSSVSCLCFLFLRICFPKIVRNKSFSSLFSFHVDRHFSFIIFISTFKRNALSDTFVGVGQNLNGSGGKKG